MGTIIVHVIVLILLFLFGFITPLPLPGEEGIIVSFGTSQDGLGISAPGTSAGQRQSERQESSASSAPSAPQQPAPAATPANIPPSQSAIVPPATARQEELLTQDYENTAAIEAARTKEREERENAAKLEQQRIADEQRKERERLDEQQRVAEQQRVERERQTAEAARRQEEERQRKEAEAKQIAEINSKVANAFGSGSASNTEGAEGTGSEGQTGKGVTFPSGNQGSPQGSPNSDNMGAGGTGQGAKGTGPSYSLDGRNALSLPKPDYPGNEEGVVVVSVTVDNRGAVTNAIAGAKGSTTYNRFLLEAARKAALQSRFNAAPDAPAQQNGTITYRFILD